MGTGDKLKVVDVVELSRHLRAEEPAGSAWRDSPSVDVFRIGPHEVTERTLVRNLHAAINKADLIKSLDFRGETTVDAENFAFDDGTDTEVVEDLTAVLPGVDVAVLAHGLFVETVDRGDAASLVIASEKGDAVWVLELEAEKKLEGFHTVVATVDEVTHEDVTRVGDLAAFFKQL